MNGFRLKRARLNAGLTLVDLAAQIGVTAGFLSQLEHNQKNVSINTLRKLAHALHCSEMWLLQNDNSPSGDMRTTLPMSSKDASLHLHVPKNKRICLNLPENRTQYEIFTPSQISDDIEAKITGLKVTTLPHEWTSEQMIMHDGFDESVLLISGTLEVHIEQHVYRMVPGDSIYIPANSMHNMLNTCDEEAVAIVYFSKLIY